MGIRSRSVSFDHDVQSDQFLSIYLTSFKQTFRIGCASSVNGRLIFLYSHFYVVHYDSNFVLWNFQLLWRLLKIPNDSKIKIKSSKIDHIATLARRELPRQGQLSSRICPCLLNLLFFPLLPNGNFNYDSRLRLWFINDTWMWYFLLFSHCDMEALSFINKHSQQFLESVLWNFYPFHGHLLCFCKSTSTIDGHLCCLNLCRHSTNWSHNSQWVCKNFYREKFQKIFGRKQFIVGMG